MAPLLQDYKFLNKGRCGTIRKNLDPFDEHRDDAIERRALEELTIKNLVESLEKGN